ncbi:hypothetical protein HWV62_22588 [Athelia sp. TMB]|nr:hypothetical protein HWV62_22588 [Athelia sp. TMB]
MTTSEPQDDSFHLHDLRVTVICPPGERILCGARDGDYFTLEGEMLSLPPNQGFSIYSLSELPAIDGHYFELMLELSNSQIFIAGAVLPLLAAKQRMTHANDWMTTDAEIACPDPHCKSRLRIERTGLRSFNHHAVTAVPLSEPGTSEADGV